MTLVLIAGVALAGGIGAVLRWVIDAVVTRLIPKAAGLGILVVNVIGSFALGLLAGIAPSGDLTLLVGAGLLGGFTTFSAVAVLSADLDNRRGFMRSAAYTIATFVLCVTLAATGHAVGMAVAVH